MNEFYDLENFPEGSRVDIGDIAEMQNVLVVRVAQSGVTIKGGDVTDYTVISCKSPARLAVIKPKEIVIVDGQTIEKTVRIKKEVPTYIYPPEPFTIRAFAELNNIENPIAYLYVKEFCEIVGVAEKPKGQRGRASALYSIKK